MTVKSRLKEVVNLLGLTNKEFERRADLANGYVAGMKISMGQSARERIVDAFPQINLSYVLLGEGSPLCSNEVENEGVETFLPSSRLKRGVPYINVMPAYNYQFRFSLAIEKNEYPRCDMFGMEGCDFVVRFRGKSMTSKNDEERSIRNGDYLGCRVWSSKSIRWGEIYTLATSSGLITTVVQQSKLKNHIRCEPLNSEKFPAYDIRESEIFDWAIVKTIVTVKKIG